MSEGGNTTQAFWAVLGVLALGGAVLYGRERKRQKRHALESGQRLQADAHARRAIERAVEKIAALEQNLGDVEHGSAKVRQKLLLALTVEIDALMRAADDADDRWSRETASRAREANARFLAVRDKALDLAAKTRNRRLAKRVSDEAIEADIEARAEKWGSADFRETATSLEVGIDRVKIIGRALAERKGYEITRRIGAAERARLAASFRARGLNALADDVARGDDHLAGMVMYRRHT